MKRGKLSPNGYSGTLTYMDNVTSNSSCNECGAAITEPAGTLPENRQPCSVCGSTKRAFEINVHDTVTAHPFMKLQDREAGKKKWRSQIQSGHDYHHATGTWSYLERVIDRGKDWYHEFITSLDGKLIHREVDEPLSKHLGRGSARKK